MVQKSSASSPMPGGTFWSLIFQSISMNSPTQQDSWPSQDWPKIKPHFSNIFARTAYSALKNYFPSYPPWRNRCGEKAWPVELKEESTERGEGAGSSYCKGEASVLGDVPVPGEHGGSAASPRGHARPPEVPFLLGGSKSIRHIILCELLEHLQGRGTGCCPWLLPPAV